MYKVLGVSAILLVTGLAVAQTAVKLSEKFEKKLEAAETTYQQAVAKADNARFYAVQKATADRVKVLKQVMTEATKSGDLDAANEIKARIAAAEASGSVRVKPKNTVKFGGHEYALIAEPNCWYTAKISCEEMGGHLIVLNSADEVAILERLCSAKQIVWLGASDHKVNDAYVWLTGESVDTTDAVLDRELNGIADVLCYDSGIHKVIDWYSGGQLPYLCEWDD
jgi:hypothetical protein